MSESEATSGPTLTATAVLDLVTPRTLVKALGLLGINWFPLPFKQLPATSDVGLYAWVIGRGHEQLELLDRPVAYVGVGADEKGGVRGCLVRERSIVSATAEHGHGRAMYR